MFDYMFKKKGIVMFDKYKNMFASVSKIVKTEKKHKKLLKEYLDVEFSLFGIDIKDLKKLYFKIESIRCCYISLNKEVLVDDDGKEETVYKESAKGEVSYISEFDSKKLEIKYSWILLNMNKTGFGEYSKNRVMCDPGLLTKNFKVINKENKVIFIKKGLILLHERIKDDRYFEDFRDHAISSVKSFAEDINV